MRLCGNCGKPWAAVQARCTHCLYEPKIIHGHLAFAPDLAEQSEGFEASYFEKLPDYEIGNFWFNSRNRLLVWALQRYFSHAENMLEIGCGTGFVLSGLKEAFPHLKFSGSEVFSAGLSVAAKRLPGVELFQMDARRIPFRDEFDVVGAFDVLEHIREDDTVLQQMYQACRKGGGIMLTVPQHPFLWSKSDDVARHVRRYRSSELKGKVRAAGFEILRVTSFVSLLFPALLASRLTAPLSRKEFDPESEFRISPVTNSLLERILNVERKLIRTGVSFPAGGSLLLIARRR